MVSLGILLFILFNGTRFIENVIKKVNYYFLSGIKISWNFFYEMGNHENYR